MYKSIYFSKQNGRQPALSFRDDLPPRYRADIDAKIRKLLENGVDMLLKTSMVEWIGPKALYELKNRELGWRIAFYSDKQINTYVLLCGWKKKKDIQQEDISHARDLLDEYLGRRKL
jgi:hypothetical protein